MGIPTLYRYANLLSLDVVAGAVCCAIFFGNIFHQPVNPLALVVLAVSVWSIYTLDHLQDALSVKGAPASRRHVFHKDHAGFFRKAVAIALVTGGCLACFLPWIILKQGFILVVPVTAYLLFHRKIMWLKEITVSILYTIGVLLPSNALTVAVTQHGIMVLAFFGIAFVNLVLFSYFDYGTDVADGHHSIVTSLGYNRSRVLIWSLFSALGVVLLIIINVSGSWILVLMAAAHAGLFVFKTELSSNEDYRLLGDAIFYLPLLILVFRP